MIFKRKWFTFAELMIVVVIMIMMISLSYAPYSYYQNKAKLKISSSEISQSISEARNLAISGIKTSSGLLSWNKSVWVFLDNSKGKNWKIYFYIYPYDTQSWSLKIPDSSSNLFKTKNLEDGVVINGSGSLLFFFEAISWESTILSFDSGNPKTLTWTVDIKFSYRNSILTTLNKTIKYDIETNTFNF